MFGSPAPCTDMPRSYAEARDFFEGRRFKANMWRNLKQKNTNVHRIPRPAMGEPAYAVQLYATDIIIYYPDGRVFLDAYESNTTNSRRDDARAPVIRSAGAMGIPKKDRLEYATRWDIKCTGRYPYGLPARDIMLAPNGDVEEIDGVPIDLFVEHVLTPIPEVQKRQRAVLGRARKILEPWCRGQDALGARVSEFDCDFSDFDRLVSDVDSGMDRDTCVAEFVQQWAEPSYFNPPESTMAGLNRAIAEYMPGNQKGDRTLWQWVPVKPENLAEVLG